MSLETLADTGGTASPGARKVRVEYGWLARETRSIVSTFGFEMSPQTWLDHDLLMDGCECLDRRVDSCPEGVRQRLAGDVITALRARSHEGFEPDEELHRQLYQLDAIFHRYQDPEYFIWRCERIFAIAEEIRLTTERSVYVDLVCEEGRCFLELFLPLFAVHATPEFMTWFPSVAEVGNLVDKLVDARADYRRGEMLIPPDLAHHCSLLGHIARKGVGAFALFPNRLRLFGWAIRFFDPRRHVSSSV